MLIRILAIFWLIFFLPGISAFAQVSRPGQPRSFSWVEAKQGLAFETMAPFDAAALIAEDQLLDTIKNIPWRFGHSIQVGFDLANSGSWHVLENGDRVWRLGIKSAGAFALSLTFSRYILPEGAELYVFKADRSRVIGAFTNFNNQADHYFVTTLIEGDELVVEYYEPQGVSFQGQLEIESINHAYRDPFLFLKNFGSSGPCNLNVACPQAASWADQVRSVGLILRNGIAWCTGALINNTANDGRPFFLTADHCFASPGTLLVWFNWQSAGCVNPATVPGYESVGSLISLARHSTTDFWLLEFSNPLPASVNPYFAGWNRTTQSFLSESIAGIHHPRGDIKKFSFSTEGVVSTSYLGAPGSGTTHWRITWSGGTTTEGGSSGSPLFDSRGRIIGQLQGGLAACGNTSPDYYGRFNVSWTGGGTPQTRLRDWLDPMGTNQETLAGFDPVAGVKDARNFSANPVSTSEIKLSWYLNELNNPVLVAYNKSGIFGRPWGEHSPGQTLTDGGEVVFFGNAEEFSHKGLEFGTLYFYRIWSKNTAGLYSEGVSAQATTPVSLQVAVKGLGTSEPAPGEHFFDLGANITLRAIPNPGWQFVNWEINGQMITEPQPTINIQTITTANARFVIPAEPGYRLYPQPVANWLLLELNAPPGKIKVEVFNLNGQVVISRELEITQPDAYQTRIEVSELISGMYVIKITGTNLNLVGKMVKL